MRGRTSLCAAALFLIAFVLPVHAGDFESPLEDGAWAIQFGIGDNFRLTTLDGTSLALKRHFSDKWCLRSTLDLAIRNEDSDEERAPIDREESEQDRVSIDLDLLYQRYFSIDGRMAMYLGAGPKWGYDTTDLNNSRTQTTPDTTVTSSSKTEQDEWRLGGSVLLGAEWFASHAISLHCEYIGGVTYMSRETTSTVHQASGSTLTSEANTTRWTVSQGDVRFGLSVYF